MLETGPPEEVGPEVGSKAGDENVLGRRTKACERRESQLGQAGGGLRSDAR